MGKKGGGMEPRKGLKRKYLCAPPVRGTQDWSGKPGFRRFEKAPEMRPKKADKPSYAFFPGFGRALFTKISKNAIVNLKNREMTKHAIKTIGVSAAPAAAIAAALLVCLASRPPARQTLAPPQPAVQDESGPALRPAAAGESPDPILALYRDDAFREQVEEFFGGLTGSPELARAVLVNAARFDIPPALAFSLCWEESRYNPRAVNRTNRNLTVDRGLFQLNNASFPQLNEAQFFNLELNARYGLSHLRWCIDAAGTPVAGLAMYNAGPSRVRSGGTPKITLDYISRILDRRRAIEALFLADYDRLTAAATEAAASVEEPLPEKPGVRLSLLSPLGRR
jgi:soluble lytic murein transglycosylase-like protein